MKKKIKKAKCPKAILKILNKFKYMRRFSLFA
jgi:hypothetical protein